MSKFQCRLLTDGLNPASELIEMHRSNLSDALADFLKIKLEDTDSKALEASYIVECDGEKYHAELELVRQFNMTRIIEKC